MRKYISFILIIMIPFVSGCSTQQEDTQDISSVEMQDAPTVVTKEEEYGEIYYIDDMLEDFRIALENDNLEKAKLFFKETCEAKLLGEKQIVEKDSAFWEAYVNNMMSLYVDFSIEMYEVELNGRGTTGTVSFRLNVDGLKSGEDYSRKIYADLEKIDDMWKFSRYVELGDK